jgi:outer membrane protein OmpA-like peptidoglycan-associated protein
MHPPELERLRQRARFDPIAEGARYRLSRELSLAIWESVCADVTDSAGRRDEERAQQRFYELAARGGRRRPDVGRVTRVAIEIDGDPLGLSSVNERAVRTPGRETLVAVEARRWAAAPVMPARPAVSSPDDRSELDAASTARDVLQQSPSEIDEASLASPVGTGGAALADSERRFFEPRFGHDLSTVRIHDDGDATARAEELGARAVAYGERIYFGSGEYAPGTTRGRALLAHELAHVIDGRSRSGASPIAQRELVEPPRLRPAGDTVRESPPAGVAIRGGTLTWRLEYVGQSLAVGSAPGGGFSVTPPVDVRITCRYTPAAGAGAASSPTVTFIQTVIATRGRLPDIGRLLMTRDPVGGAAVDADIRDTEPYYGADPRVPGPGLGAATGVGQTPGSTQSLTPATHGDAPFQRRLQRGTAIERRFEAGVICVESAETFGSLFWGYTKTADGEIRLLGATPADVRQQPSAGFEAAQQGFYRGQFQHSLSNFARGSSTLTPAHQAMLRSIPITNLTRIILVGANDNSGGPEANAQLSLDRANAVRQFLISQMHVSASLITIEGHGVEARVPNAAGQEMPANRRVDVHYEQGSETPRPATGAIAGSSSERARLNRQNPRLTIGEAVDLIDLLDTQPGQISDLDIEQLDAMLRALDRWRTSDPTIPDLRTIYATQIQGILGRARMHRPDQPPFPRHEPPDDPHFIDRILQDADRLMREDH